MARYLEIARKVMAELDRSEIPIREISEKRVLPGLSQSTEDRPVAAPADGRAAWTRSVTLDSRHQLIPPEVRSKIEGIETEARRLGWPPELLWNANFWELPLGLAAVLEPHDEIAEVTAESIVVLKSRYDLLKFLRHVT